MATARDRFIEEFEKRASSRNNAVAETYSVSENARDRFIAEYESAYNKIKGQTESVPEFVYTDKNENVPQQQPAPTQQPERKDDKSLKERYKNLNYQLSAFNEIKGKTAEDYAKIDALNKEKDSLEKQLKIGLYDDDLNVLDRLQLSAQYIGESYNATPGVLAETAKQAYKDHKQYKEDDFYKSSKKNLEDINKKVREFERYKERGFGNLIDNAEYEKIKAEQERRQTAFNAKYVTPMDMNAEPMQRMVKAMQKQEKAKEGLGNVGGFLWDTGTSVVDNAALMPLAMLPGGTVISSGMLGAKSAAMKAVDVGQEGGSAKDALVRGLSSGAIEALTEKIPMDNLADMIKAPNGKKAIWNIIKQAGMEGTEEEVSYIANAIMDAAANNTDPYAEMSLIDAVTAFAGGALSGGVMGAGGQIVGKIANKNNADVDSDTLPNEAEQREEGKTDEVLEAAEQLTEDVDFQQQTEADLEEQEKIALANKIKEDLGIAEENEVEKTISQQQEKIDNIQKLVDDGIVPQEELETAKIKAEENIKEAENRQANLDYQDIDKDSGAVRQSIINEGKGKVIENIENFAAKKGLKVKYYSADADTAGNGFIEGDVIYLNAQDEKVMIKTAVHEIIHGLKRDNLENFYKMSREILNYAESNRHLLGVVENTIKAYTNPESIAYNSILDENGDISPDKLSEEVLCKLCEEIIDDPEGFIEKVGHDRTILESFAYLLRRIKNSLAIKFAKSDEARLDNAVMVLERYLQGDGKGVEQRKHSYGGTRANEAPEGFLKAERMAEFGEDNENIRKETGWFKGVDGKLRFEIDDSKMNVEVDNLSETAKPLGEVVNHSELFKNYPRFKEIKIELAELPQGVDGETLTSGKIRINKNVTDTNKIKKILIHEIQHLIQQEEGFASGANVEYWKNKGDVAAQQRAVRRLEKQKNRYEEMYKKWSAEFKAMADKMLNNEEWVEGRNKEEYERIEQIAAEKYPDEYDEYFDISWDLLTAHNAVKNSGETSLYTAYDNYWNTAGEQEARDVEKRLNYTAEQRQDVRPFVGNDDTVFVGKGIKSEHISDTAEQEIDKALANKNYRQEIKLRDFTPKILVEHGVKDLKMVMNASHLRENIFTEEEAAAKGLKINSGINYHGLGKDLFMQVIDSLDNPQRVYRGTKNADNSSRGENYFLIISTLKDKDGNFINVPVYVAKEGFHNKVSIDANKIATVYGKTNINKYIDKQIKHGNLVKINRSSNKSNRPSPIDGVKDVTTSKNNVPQSSQNSNGKKHAEVVKNDTQFSQDISNDEEIDLKGLSIKEMIDEAAKKGVTTKSQNYQNRAENRLAKSISNAFNVSYADNQDFIKKMVKEITTELKQTGKISEDKVNRIMDIAFEKGKMLDDDFLNQYPKLKRELREYRFKWENSSVFDRVKTDYSRKIFFGEDGIPVDVAYKELSDKYPNLFSEKIVNSEDQLERIAEVYDMLKAREMSLSEYYGENAGAVKDMIKDDLQAAIKKYADDINDVIAYEQEKQRIKEEREKRKNAPKLTQEEYTAKLDELFFAKKNRDKFMDGVLLTEGEKNMVNQLLVGGDERLIPEDKKEKVLMAYEVMKPVKELQDEINQYKADIKQKRYEVIDDLLRTFRSWKDKKIGLGYSTETFERIIRDVVSDQTEADRIIDELLKPIHAAEAARTLIKKKMRDKVRELKLNTGTRAKDLYDITIYGKNATQKLKVNESGLVQLLGEKRITEKQVEECGADLGKIKNAVKEFSKIYKELYKLANDALIRNGYDPMGELDNYFPHFTQEDDGVLSKFAKKLGFEVQSYKLPTTISGVTETFRPGRQYFGNLFTRKGDVTEFDAVTGFDQYIEGVSNIIYHTDNIQNLRAFEDRVRYLMSDKGIREQLDAIDLNETLSVEAKQTEKDKIYKTDKGHLSEFVKWLRDYTNNLAGKKDITDRGIEHDIGRGIYTMSKALESRITSNMIGGNISSALTNFIPIVQSVGQVKTKNLLKAMQDTMVSMCGKDDGFVMSSDFLINRTLADDKLVYTTTQKLADRAGLVMNTIDEFTSNVIVRAKYMQNIDKGMSHIEAIDDANSFAANLMADRSKGAVPLIFQRKNPIAKAFTMFQIEQNNQFRYLMKDLPRELKEEGVKVLMLAVFKIAVASWLFNNLYEMLVGRRPAFDPIDIAWTAASDIKKVKDGKMRTSEMLGKNAMNIAEEIPFVGGFIGGGRIPISSALPDLGEIGKLLDREGEVSSKKKLDIVKKELSKPFYYLALPTGGGQIKKVVDAIDLAKNDGVQRSVLTDGNTKVQFVTDSPAEIVQSAVFGKWASDGARSYLDNNFKGLTKGQTENFDMFKAWGMSNKSAFEKAKETKALSESQLNILSSLQDAGVSNSKAFDISSGIRKDADTDGNGSLTVKEAVAYIDSLGLSRAQRAALFEAVLPKVKNNPYKK